MNAEAQLAWPRTLLQGTTWRTYVVICGQYASKAYFPPFSCFQAVSEAAKPIQEAKLFIENISQHLALDDNKVQVKFK